MKKKPAKQQKAVATGTRDVMLGDAKSQLDVYKTDTLVPGNVISGPAIIETTQTTYLLPPGWTLKIDSAGDGHIKSEISHE